MNPAPSIDILSEEHKQALRFLVKLVRDGSIPTEFKIQFQGENTLVHADKVKEVFAISKVTPLGLDILTHLGLIFSRPSYETRSHTTTSQKQRVRIAMQQGYPVADETTAREKEVSRDCLITPAGYHAVDSDFSPTVDLSVHKTPEQITTSLAKFRGDFPDTTRLAFVIMRFKDHLPNNKILEAIDTALAPHQFVALRADNKDYADNVYDNILTYAYGCRFGIAVFDRIETDQTNPNVAFEVGFMHGLRKQVCLLKDQTIPILQTDLMGKLYKPFDPHDPGGTIPTQLHKWMRDWGFIA